MVRGLKKFSEYFSGHEGNYVLIGGAASHILEEEALLVPRATKDLDIILIVEALTDEFVAKFWSFIKDAGYEHIQKGVLNFIGFTSLRTRHIRSRLNYSQECRIP